MSDSEITPEIIELILRTSRVKACHNIFSLAPRGHRVGFYFQQRRATLLAAALRSRLGRDQLSQSKIGIVGGGISGLTVLCALSNEGAERVCLFEAEDQVINTAARSSHRLVHPNYNRWPLLGSMDVFTRLPVLNWFAAPGDQVMDQIRAEMSTDHEDLEKDSIRLKHRVRHVSQRGVEFADPLRVTYDFDGRQETEDFKIVILAVGFDQERAIGWGLDDYWTQGADEFDVDEHQRPATIYGAGDGALIDIIRCCAKDPSNAWQIPLGTIARLRSEEATSLLNDCSAGITLKLSPFRPIEKKIQTHEEGIRCIAWSMSEADPMVRTSYLREEEEFYRSLIKGLQKDAGRAYRFLQEYFKPVAADPLRPILVGEEASGFEPTSAPINKLLFAYLLETNRVLFVSRDRKTQTAELSAVTAKPPPERRKCIVICRHGARKNFPLKGDLYPPQANGVVVDVKGDTDAVSETRTEAQLIDALSGTTGGEYVFFDAMPDPLTQARYGLNQDGILLELRKKNKVTLTRFAQVHLDASQVTLSSSRQGVGPKWVIMTKLDDDEISERLLSMGGLDGHFFGVPIVVARPESSFRGEF